ncbi:MAG: hypothetical protein LBJ08_11990 [Bifidobacteriaceae bacterium]|jgi:hypothetical protein|nr:hypothetical protein [Bifidobacteriaceae bacterium]
MTAEPVVNSGDFTARMDADGWICDIAFSGIQILDAIYAVPRELDWETPPTTATIGELSGGNALTARFEAQTPGARVRWTVAIRTIGDGLEIRFEATCDSPVDLKRFGLVLLHTETTKIAGISSDTRPIPAIWPARIAPGPLFSQARELNLHTAQGIVHIGFDSPTETEDHRNWSDPGWKTYFPPLCEGNVHLDPHDPIEYTITLKGHRASGPSPHLTHPRPGHRAEASVAVGGGFLNRPKLGTQVFSFSNEEGDVVAGYGLDFVLVRTHIATAIGQLELAYAFGERYRARVDFQVLVPPNASSADVMAVARVAADASDRVTVQPFGQQELATTRALMGVFGDSAGGSALYYAELNRAPHLDQLGTVVFGAASQVHQGGTAWMLRTPPVMDRQIEDARRQYPGARIGLMPLVMTSLTRARDGRDADPRYDTPIAAGWLAGVLYGTAGADEVSVLRATGPAGLETEGSPTPAGALLQSHMRPDARIVPIATEGRVLALATDDGRSRKLTVANADRKPVRVAIREPSGLFPETLELAAWQVETFSSDGFG